MGSDQGIWAIWYDVTPYKRKDYLNWLHNHHLPQLMMRSGYEWVAHYERVEGGDAMKIYEKTLARPTGDDVPTGSQFLIIVGGESTHTFFNPSVFDNSISISDFDKQMLAMQHNRRSCVFKEEIKVRGPSYQEHSKGYIPSPAIQFGSFCLSSIEAEYEIGKWYAQYKLPALAKMPGCVAVHKLLSVAGWAKHGILYEFDSLVARLKNFELPIEAKGLDTTSWSHKVVATTVHSPGSPTVAKRIWPL